MKRCIFTTKQYDEDEKRYKAQNACEQMDKIRAIFERGDDLPKSDYYSSLSSNYCVRGFGGNHYKIIITYKDISIEDETIRVFIALRIMRHDKQYENRFAYSKTSEQERDIISGKASLVWDDYEKLAKEKFAQPIEKVVEIKPELSDCERLFITDASSVNHRIMEEAIFESTEWVKQVKSDSFGYYSDAAQIIKNFVFEHISDPSGTFEIPFVNYYNKKIIGYHEGSKKWFLITIADTEKRVDVDMNNFDFKRGYPYSMLDDEDFWREMEKDDESNFVLSEEEMDIVSREASYPLFISGRAGSGKSTVLQYLFAEVILKAIKCKGMVDDGALLLPVYLSYSENLIENAKKLTSSLFEKNHAYQQEFERIGISYANDIKPNLDYHFCVFQNVIRQCIGKQNPDVLRDRFSLQKYMSFRLFNKKWEEKFLKVPDASKKYGPSLCWHVIRTYIKGWNSSSFMTPEEYKGIGKQNKTVTDETFKIIYELVWQGWYSIMNDYWDDQDLVRYCLSPDDGSCETYTSERFSAVFCDEAQDFTRVEIDFILKISSFSNRNIISVDDVKKLPFVFAGDEFQTLNPTGFSWDSIRAFFVDRLFDMVGLGERKDESNIEKPVMLTKNYRSTPEIMKLGNRIQLLRSSRFGEESNPQESYFKGEGGSVFGLSPNDAGIWKKLQEMKVVLIAPIDEGESVKDYIERKGLMDYIDFDDETHAPKYISILSPIQAKGLDYPNVAIYGFDDLGRNNSLSTDSLLQWFDNPTENNLNDSIELKYILSNSYVAATRACTKLYILDDFDKVNSFWAFAYSFDKKEYKNHRQIVETLQSQMLNKAKGWTVDNIGLIIHGEDEDITDENITDDKRIERLEMMERRAENRGDEDMMRQVANRYKDKEGESENYFRCMAQALRIGEDSFLAAEYFIKAKMFDNAVDAYWSSLAKNQNVSVIKEIAVLSNKISGPVEREIVKLCEDVSAKRFSISDLKSHMGGILDLMENNNELSSHPNSLNYVISLLANQIDLQKGTETDLEKVLEAIKKLEKWNIKVPCNRIARLAYNLKQYQKAIILWEKADENDLPQDYYQAKIETSEYPDRLPFYEKSGLDKWQDRIVKDFVEHGRDLEIEPKYARVICNAIVNTNDKVAFKQNLHHLFAFAENDNQLNSYLKEAKQRGIVLNEDAICALSAVRFHHLTEWKNPTPSVIYSDTKANDLLDMVEYIKKANHPEFINEMLNAKKMKDFLDNTFAKYRGSDYLPLLIKELGVVMEKRGIHIDAIRFYEWARSSSKSSELKRYCDLRWIVCKERQADRDVKSNYWSEAFSKRKELDIGQEDIPEMPTIEFKEWCSYFKMAMALSADIHVPAPEKTIDVLADNKEISASQESRPNKEKDFDTVTDTFQIKKQLFVFNNYEICFLPKTKEVVIKYETSDEDLSVKIKQGIVFENGDFVLVDSRLCHADNDIKTPFDIQISDKELTINIFQDDIYTGIKITYDL